MSIIKTKLWSLIGRVSPGAITYTPPLLYRKNSLRIVKSYKPGSLKSERVSREKRRRSAIMADHDIEGQRQVLLHLLASAQWARALEGTCCTRRVISVTIFLVRRRRRMSLLILCGKILA